MAFNWSTFKTRALTAIVFVAVMLTGLLWNQWSFFILFSIIHFGCWWEYLSLVEKIRTTRFHPYLKLGWMLAGYGLLLTCCGPAYRWGGYELGVNLGLPVSAAGFALLMIGIFLQRVVKPAAIGMAALGVLYISLSWAPLLRIRQAGIQLQGDAVVLDGGKTIPILLILSIWINDTMAYIVGSFIGKTPLSPISPKKTWEGTAGGALLAVIVMATAGAAIAHTSPVQTGILAAIAAVAGTVGDLLESRLKRMAGVKDSGSIMPGHGGFMDRFDSLLLATPCVWIYLQLV